MIYIFKIKNYNPKFYSNCKDFLRHNKNIINSIIGQEIEEIIWVWDENRENWNKEFPVSIKLTDGFINLCSFNYGDFSIGVNNIDFNSKPLFHKQTNLGFSWRTYKSSVTDNLLHKKITSVEIVNFLPRFINDLEIYDKHEEKIIKRMGFLHGFGFNIDNQTLVIANGLDNNNIVVFEKDFPNYYTRIIISSI